MTNKVNEMVKVLKAGKFNTADGVEFEVGKVEVHKVNGKETVIFDWGQKINDGIFAGAALQGLSGFYFKGNNLKVVNFDSNHMAMNDIAGCNVKFFASKVGCFTRYDRKNPDTFDVVYI